MNRNCSNNFVFPGEYRKAAEHLFPRDGLFRSQKPDLKSTAEFAKTLGLGNEFQRLVALDNNSAEMRTFLDHFQNNLDLLIQKTWVEKSDEDRKGKLQDKIPLFMDSLYHGDITQTVDEFAMILEELAYLFFGVQSEKDDFTEYTFRIDAQMGLFWWYGGKLSSFKELKDKDDDDRVLWAILLIGLCYLTNF
ncbi:MAG: hypothetical protein LBQ82_01185 [Treponema sp.]|jgi:hypothetical protein|nr:hypothetical protein [Treponema sp.]